VCVRACCVHCPRACVIVTGRTLFGPIMKTGVVSVLAFIGTSTAASSLHQLHPQPFTVWFLYVCRANARALTRHAGLTGTPGSRSRREESRVRAADGRHRRGRQGGHTGRVVVWRTAVCSWWHVLALCVDRLSRSCTAIKIVFVHESIADAFVPRFAAAVDALTIGMPWDGCDITCVEMQGGVCVHVYAVVLQ
jgi:hypothetical protein